MFCLQPHQAHPLQPSWLQHRHYVFYRTAKMELISTGILCYHLLFDQGINPLFTFKNSYMDEAKQTPNTLHSCYYPMRKPHPSFCLSFSLYTFPATLCICSLSEAEQIPEASKEIIFILCSPTTVHSAIPWVILHHRAQLEVDTAPNPLFIYQPAKIPSSYPTHTRLCPKIYFKPLSLGSEMLRHL